MLSGNWNILDLVAAGSVFGLVLILVAVFVMLWSMRRKTIQDRVEQRLEIEADDGKMRILRLWHDGEEIITKVARSDRSQWSRNLERMRHEAGFTAPIWSLLAGVMGLCGLLFLFVYVLLANFVVAMLVVVAVLLVLRIYLQKRIRRCRGRMEQQLVDALELSARSLRAGHPLTGAFRLVSEEVDPPVGTMFREICHQQNLGVTLNDALRTVAQRSTSEDLKLFATSVAIQMKSGGNLADMMDRLAFVIRERFRLGRRIRVLTAQTQFSKNVLLALPFALFTVLNVLGPQYMETLYVTWPGNLLLGAAAFSLLMGAWMMNRMVELRV